MDVITALCVDGWLDTYRGLVPDDFLEHSLWNYLYAKYQEEMAPSKLRQRSFLVEEQGDVLGFAQIVIDNNERTGTLLDSLYVARDIRGGGVGTQLLLRTAELVLEEAKIPRLHLFTLQSSEKAQRFYEKHGAVRIAEDNEFHARCGYTYGVYQYAWKNVADLFRV